MTRITARTGERPWVLSFVLGAWGAVGLTGCGAGALRAGVDPSGAQCQRDFGSSTAAAKIETFLAATAELERAVFESERAVHDACAAAAEDAGPGAVALDEPGAGSLEVCRRLGSWLSSERAALSEAGVEVRVAVAPPACAVSMDDYAGCVSSCELRYRPTEIEVQCSVEAEGRSCSGALTSPQAGPRCRASCETRMELAASCTPGSARLEARLADGTLLAPGAEQLAPEVAPEPAAELAPELRERVARLQRVWETQGARLQLLRVRLERTARAASHLLAIAPVLPEAAATVSIRAVACASAAAETAARTSERMRVTLEMSSMVAP